MGLFLLALSFPRDRVSGVCRQGTRGSFVGGGLTPAGEPPPAGVGGGGVGALYELRVLGVTTPETLVQVGHTLAVFMSWVTICAMMQLLFNLVVVAKATYPHAG